MTEDSIRILQIASGDLWAGAEVQVYNLCKGLAATPGVAVHAVVLNPGILEANLRRLGVEVTVLDESRLGFFAILRSLCGLVRRIKPDIIHSHRIKENMLGGLASRVRPGTRCVNTVHGAPEHRPSWTDPKRLAARWAHDAVIRLFFSRTVLVSDELLAAMERRYGAAKCRVIPNALDIENVLSRSAGSAPNDPETGTGRVNVAFLGRLVPVKRLDLFVAIAAELLARAPERYGFYIIGDGPLRDEVRGLIEAKELGSGVRMLGFCENPLPVLRRMDCLLVTSDHEGLPTNVLEAMCLKVAVVSRNLPGIAGALGQGAYGELVDGDAPAAYADAIERAFAGAGPAREKADRAYEHVCRHYGHDIMAGRYMKLYELLLERR